MNGLSNNNIGERYIPGVCNIGKSEIKRRKQAGWSGLIITVILLGLLVYFDVPRPWRLVIFIPAMMTANYVDRCAQLIKNLAESVSELHQRVDVLTEKE